jgi:hypothetical protein
MRLAMCGRSTPIALVLLAFAAGCQKSAGPPAAASAAYTPGLGEIMSLQQMRHTKLWFCRPARHWPLRP